MAIDRPKGNLGWAILKVNLLYMIDADLDFIDNILNLSKQNEFIDLSCKRIEIQTFLRVFGLLLCNKFFTFGKYRFVFFNFTPVVF